MLRSLGRPDHLAQSSVRFSVGRQTTMQDIETASGVFARAVAHLRSIAPALAVRA